MDRQVTSPIWGPMPLVCDRVGFFVTYSRISRKIIW